VTQPAQSDLALSTRGLHKRYGARVALAGLDLSVPSGVVYGFLGPNGAGKTTTMRLLTGLIRPDAGSIELLGRPFGGRDRHRLFEVGALIESPSFYPYLSGRENLRALAATGAPPPRSRLEELLESGPAERACDKVPATRSA
jgi:ABC-2 type transport system ATP-binding protein